MGLGGLLRALLGNSLELAGYCLGFGVMTDTTLYNKLKDFIECEGKSCSYDPELKTPEYVCRMWGGVVVIEDIASAMKFVKLPM